MSGQAVNMDLEAGKEDLVFLTEHFHKINDMPEAQRRHAIQSLELVAGNIKTLSGPPAKGPDGGCCNEAQLERITQRIEDVHAQNVERTEDQRMLFSESKDHLRDIDQRQMGKQA